MKEEPAPEPAGERVLEAGGAQQRLLECLHPSTGRCSAACGTQRQDRRHM